MACATSRPSLLPELRPLCEFALGELSCFLRPRKLLEKQENYWGFNFGGLKNFDPQQNRCMYGISQSGMAKRLY